MRITNSTRRSTTPYWTGNARRAWISRRRACFVDPLDGTREFVEGRLDAVQCLVGVAVGDTPVCGAVGLPFPADGGPPRVIYATSRGSVGPPTRRERRKARRRRAAIGNRGRRLRRGPGRGRRGLPGRGLRGARRRGQQTQERRGGRSGCRDSPPQDVGLGHVRAFRRRPGRRRQGHGLFWGPAVLHGRRREHAGRHRVVGTRLEGPRRRLRYAAARRAPWRSLNATVFEVLPMPPT